MIVRYGVNRKEGRKWRARFGKIDVPADVMDVHQYVMAEMQKRHPDWKPTGYILPDGAKERARERHEDVPALRRDD